MKQNEVLLMTATINPMNTPDVTIKVAEERLFQYLCSLFAWIKFTNIETIVLCENSNTSYDFAKIINFAKSEGKTLEVLVFDGNQGSQNYGKGYGEGKIIQHAIQNSSYLNKDVDFYKITGRLFVSEFDTVQQIHANHSNVFRIPAFRPEEDPWAGVTQHNIQTLPDRLRAIARFIYVFLGRGRGRAPHNYNQHVSTIFYKANVGFYQKYLMNSYKRVNDRKSYAIEHVFYEDLIKREFSPFLTDYRIVGRGGGSGRLIDGLDYGEDIKSLARSFL